MKIKRFIKYWHEIFTPTKKGYEGIIAGAAFLITVLGIIGYTQNFKPLLTLITFSTGAAFLLRALFWLPFKKNEEKQAEIDKLTAERDAEVDYVIELVPEDERERHLTELNGELRYCHHLQIRVLNRQHKLEKCEPILKYIKTIPDPSWGQQPETIPVDSRLEFYQSELDDSPKNISGTQKFDLGQTFHVIQPAPPNATVWEGFRFTISHKLNAKLEMLERHKEQFRAWANLEVGITLRAENVQTPKLFKFKISVVPIRLLPGTLQQIEASIITVIS